MIFYEFLSVACHGKGGTYGNSWEQYNKDIYVEGFLEEITHVFLKMPCMFMFVWSKHYEYCLLSILMEECMGMFCF